MRIGLVIQFLLFICTPLVLAQSNRVVKKDLKADWLMYSDQQLVSQSSKQTATIYFFVDLENFTGDHLLLGSSRPFAVFIDGKLALDEAVSVKLSIDSLAEVLEKRKLLFAIHQKPLINTDLTTQIISEIILPVESEVYKLKPNGTGYINFMIVASLLLLLFVILIFRFNSNLASDYFSIQTFLSLREADDHPMFNRIGGTTNLFAYGLVSLATALLLIQIPLEYNVFATENPNEFSGWMLHWFATGLLVLAILFLKSVVLVIFCILFNMRELAGFHFFSFVRFLLFVVGVVLAFVVAWVFSTGIQTPGHQAIMGVLHYALIGWIGLLFFKLLDKTSHSAIHLFLYICATEIIPFLILIKVYK
ncbi:MAG: DUF4271 domain-containing protein [Cyclobacteriaceae bacterium]